MKAITTKFLPTTATRGSRIKAWDLDGNSVTIDYEHDKSFDARHALAAKALCEKMGWQGALIEGFLAKNQRVYVWVPFSIDVESLTQPLSIFGRDGRLPL